jgi:spore coat protein CotH
MTWLVVLLAACTRPSEGPMLGNQVPQPQRDPSVDDDPPPVAAPRVVFNEVQADNMSTWQDEDYLLPDWIEIYNDSTEPVALDRIEIKDASGADWEGAPGVLAPGSVLMLIADDGNGDLHLPFSLSKDGDELTIEVDDVVTDRVFTGALAEDLSVARFPDGGGWAPTARPTPGWPNGIEPSATLDPADVLFSREVVTTVQLFIEPSLFDDLDNRVEVAANANIDGIYFEGVGVKLKGSGTWQSMSGKPNFKVDFNEGHPGRKYRGMKGFQLHNSSWDPSFTREYMAYKPFLDAGAPASRVGFVRVYVNATFYGLFTHVEWPDDMWVDRNFQDPSGVLWEGQSGNDDPGSGGYSPTNSEVDEGDPQLVDLSPMWQMDSILGAPEAHTFDEFESLVDIDPFLTFMAAEEVADNWDGYTAPHNFRIYLEPARTKVHFMTSGVDVAQWAHAGFWDSNGNAAQFCYDKQECNALYEAKLLAMADMIEDLDYVAHYQDLVDFLRPYAQEDDRNDFSMREFEDETELIYDNILQKPAYIRDEVGQP